MREVTPGAAYTLDLPPELVKRRLHPTFHVSLLREHVAAEDVQFPERSLASVLSLGDETFEKGVNEIIGYRWIDGKPVFFVNWSDGLTTEETHETVAQLQAFEDFCDARGINS
ncbi:hypothetical protein AURDEDRAFT_54096, partial [Auricularia subglabra TFB-10046 SS5]